MTSTGLSIVRIRALGSRSRKPLEQLGTGDIAEQHVIAFLPRGGDAVDVAVDRQIVLVVRVEHVGDHPPDAAEAEDDDLAELGGLERASICRPAPAGDAAAGEPPELGEQRRDGQADRGDDLPEGRGLRR